MKFTIKDRITTAEPNAVLSYALDYRAEFEVDDEWTDKVITARFVHSNGEYIDVVLDNFGCNIPLFPKGVLWVGAYTDAFTSTAVPVPIGVTIKDLGEHEAIPPTADVYQQIIALIEAGRLKGDKGDPGEDYIITESDYQAIAERVPQPDLTDYVRNTDYATSSKGGTVIASPNFALNVTNGKLNALSLPYNQYQTIGTNTFIGKGTLENVLAERMKEPQFELIEDITLTENVAKIERSAEPNGTPYNLGGVLIKIKVPPQPATISNAQIRSQARVGNAWSSPFTVGSGCVRNNATTYFWGMYIRRNGMYIGQHMTPATSSESSGTINTMYNLVFLNDNPIDRILIEAVNMDTIPIGTNIKIYAVRG